MNQMIVEIGKDGLWCASGSGYLRPIATSAPTRKEAMKMYAEAHYEQQVQEYAFCESMSHLTDISSPDWTPESGHNYER